MVVMMLANANTRLAKVNKNLNNYRSNFLFLKNGLFKKPVTCAAQIISTRVNTCIRTATTQTVTFNATRHQVSSIFAAVRTVLFSTLVSAFATIHRKTTAMATTIIAMAMERNKSTQIHQHQFHFLLKQLKLLRQYPLFHL